MPPTPVASEYQKACSAVPTCPLASSRTKPVARANRSTDEPAPSLHPDSGGSSLLRAGPSADAATVLNASQFLLLGPPPPPPAPPRGRGYAGAPLPPSHAEAAARPRPAPMPDPPWPISGPPPGSSRRHLTAPVLMSAA